MAVLVFSLAFMGGTGLEQQKELLSYASMAAAGIGVIALMELSQSITYHMAELEQSCYLNLKQTCVIKMIFFGGLNLAVVAVVAGMMSARTVFSFVSVCLYLFVPFTISNIGYLMLFTLEKNGKKLSQITAAFLMSIAACIPSAFPKAYEEINLGIWAVILTAGVLILAAEIKSAVKRLKGGEELCWN